MIHLDTDATKGPTSSGVRVMASVLVLACVTAVVLAFTVNTKLPYEQDQAAKAAKIQYLAKTNNFIHPEAGPAHYHDWMFSFYYSAMSVIYALVGGGRSILGFMNIASVCMGVVFFVAICYAINRAYRVRFLDSWIVFISIPVVILNFTYGNEVSFSLSLFAVAMAILCSSMPYRSFVAAALVAAAMFSRPDILFLTPFLAAWTALYGGSSRQARDVFRRVITLLVMVAVFCLLHWLVFLRSPLPSHLYVANHHINIRYHAATLTYPFCPTIVLLGLGSLVFYSVVRRQKDVLILALLALPLVYYWFQLSSPKFVISLALFYGIPAAIAISRMKPLPKVATVLAIAVWWVFSISPYGITGPDRGHLFFFPTADGRFPTGSYATFYDKVRRGWYQERYRAEYLGVKQAVHYMATSKNNTRVYGYFNGQFFELALIEQGSFDWSDNALPWDLESLPSGGQILMISRSYLRQETIGKEQWEKVCTWLTNGQIRPISDEDSPFPLVVEIGDTVPLGTDKDLGQRILFLNTYCKGHGAVESGYFSSMFYSTSWVPREAAVNLKESPLYVDGKYCCFASYVPGATLWRMPMPYMYFSERSPERY
jgi:hypothetical protein